MSWLYIREATGNHRLARKVGELEGHGYYKYVIEYIDEDGYDTGEVELCYPSEKFEIATFQNWDDLARFAGKLDLVRKNAT